MALKVRASLLKIDYLTEDVVEGDLLVVFISRVLSVFGLYEKSGSVLKPLKLFSDDQMPNLRDFYGKLSFVDSIEPRTYKLFAKKTRKVSKEDFELFKKIVELAFVNPIDFEAIQKLKSMMHWGSLSTGKPFAKWGTKSVNTD